MSKLDEVRGASLTKYGAKRAHYEHPMLERHSLAVLAIRMRYPEIFSPEDVEEARGLVQIVQEPRLLKQAMLDAEEARKRTEKLRLKMNPGVTKKSLKRKAKALGNAV